MKKRFYFISAIILFCLTIIFYNKLVFSDLTYFQRDLMIQFRPWKMFINYHLKNLFYSNSTYLDFLPLWNFYNRCGSPLIANLQSQVFYPFSVVFFVIKDFVVAYKIFLILHFFLSSFFMYILLKKKLSFVSSLCGSIIWTFNGYIVSRTEFLSVFSTLIWLPLIIYLFPYITDKFDFKKIVFVSIIITMQFLAGHAQIWFYSIVYLLLYSVYLSYKHKSYIPIVSCLLSILFSILISAIQFLPTTEFFYYSTRSGKGIKDITKFGMSYKDTVLGSLNLKDIINFVYPFSWQFNIKNFAPTEVLSIPNYWWYTFYIGFIGICLSIIGFFYIKENKEKSFYVFIILLFLLYSLGENFILFKQLYKFIPFIRIFRYPSTSIFILVFILSLLTSYGTEFIFLFVKRYKKYRYLFIIIFPIVCFIELYTYSTKISILLPKTILEQPTPNPEFLLQKKFEDKYPYRFALTPITQNLALSVKGKTLYESMLKYRDRLFGDENLEFLLFNFRGQDIELKNYYKFLDFVYSCSSLDEAVPFLSISNVKYIISIIPQNTKLLKLIKNNELKIYENPFVLPPAFFVTKKIEETNLDNALKLMKELKFELFDTVILHHKNTQNLNYQSNHLIDRLIDKFYYLNNKIYVETNFSQEGFLVLTQNFYPGWKCLVNNKKTEIYYCNIFMNCIYLPREKNKIWFYYDPISFKIGCIITLLCILFIIVYIYETK